MELVYTDERPREGKTHFLAVFAFSSFFGRRVNSNNEIQD